MTTLRVGIASYDEMKALTLAIARGQRKLAPQEPRVWFPSTCGTRIAGYVLHDTWFCSAFADLDGADPCDGTTRCADSHNRAG